MKDAARRHLLGAAGAAIAAACWPAISAAQHAAFGIVRPALMVPNIAVTDMRGASVDLARMLRGHVTAVHLMFTGCTATCPIQGAIFADAQARLDAADTSLRLLSVSIDPLGDDVPALRAWLQRFGARQDRWTAALPKPQGVDPLLDFVRGRASGADRHTAQAYLFNRRAELVFRSADVASGESLVATLRQLAAFTPAA